MTADNHDAPRAGLRTFFGNGLVQILAALTASFWIAAFFLSGSVLIEIITMALIGMLAVVVYRWGLVAYADLADGKTGGRPQLAVGILSLSLSMIGVLVWTLAWRWQGFPEWMIESPILGFMRMWSVVGAGLMVTAPGSVQGIVPLANWRWIVVAVAIGAGLFGFTLGSLYRPAVIATPPAFHRSDPTYPVCPPDRQVFGSAGDRYHEPSSPYRMTFYPVRCFESVEEAEAYGFFRPG